MPDRERDRARGLDADEGGDTVCWLDRVCPACGRLNAEPGPACEACGNADW